jgi:hypothetical protein
MIALLLSDMDFTVNCGSPVYRKGNMIMRPILKTRKRTGKRISIIEVPRGVIIYGIVSA